MQKITEYWRETESGDSKEFCEYFYSPDSHAVVRIVNGKPEKLYDVALLANRTIKAGMHEATKALIRFAKDITFRDSQQRDIIN